jgi:hypothetical protein
MYAQTGEHLASMLYGMVAGAAPDGVDVGPAWGDAYSPANVHAPTDAEVCDAAEATVSALWPQGDAPAGDECAAFSDVPLDTPMPPAFVDALAALSPAEAGAIDLDALHARLWSPTCSQCGAVDPPTEDAERWDGQRFLLHVDCPKPDDIYASEVGDHGLTRAEQRALVARVRELEAEADEYDALIQRQGALLLATADAHKGPPPPLSQHSAQELPEVAAALVARLAAAQPAVALDALRNGRFTAHCCACSAEWPLGVRDCPGCGHPDRDAGAVPDRDLCPHCGALDLDHVCAKSAATVAGEAFAAEHPEAAGRILG